MTDDLKRMEYEALRVSLWAIRDALASAASIAGRPSDCFDGTPLHAEFNELRNAIERVRYDSDEMRRLNSALHAARKQLG